MPILFIKKPIGLFWELSTIKIDYRIVEKPRNYSMFFSSLLLIGLKMLNFCFQHPQ